MDTTRAQRASQKEPGRPNPAFPEGELTREVERTQVHLECRCLPGGALGNLQETLTAGRVTTSQERFQDPKGSQDPTVLPPLSIDFHITS